MNNYEDTQFGPNLKRVTVLSCVPGSPVDSETGPIAILNLAHEDEIEQPLRIDLPDVRRLAISFMAVLAKFTNEFPDEIMDIYFGGTALPQDDRAANLTAPIPIKKAQERKRPMAKKLMSYADVRYVKFLKCQTARENGSPSCLLTLGHSRQPEQPILLSLEDTRQMTKALFGFLARHGDQAVMRLIQQLRWNESAPTPSESPCVEVAAPPAPSTPKPSDDAETPQEPSKQVTFLPSTGLRITIRFHDAALKPIEAEVLGGYGGKKATMIILRTNHFGSTVEFVAKLGSGTITTKGLRADEVLDIKEMWRRFYPNHFGSVLRIGRRCYTVLAHPELRRLLGKKAFVFANAE